MHCQRRGHFSGCVICLDAGDNLSPVHLTVLVSALVEGLQGRLWDGKVSQS